MSERERERGRCRRLQPLRIGSLSLSIFLSPFLTINYNTFRSSPVPNNKQQTDHAGVMKELEKVLTAFHSVNAAAADLRRSEDPTAPPPEEDKREEGPYLSSSSSSSSSSSGGAPLVDEHAFALVGWVDEGSPASAAGLQGNDRIVRFGAMRRWNAARLTLTVATATETKGVIEVVVLRNSSSSFSGAAVGSTAAAVAAAAAASEGDGGGGLGERRYVLRLRPKEWSGKGNLGCHISELQTIS